MCPPIQLPASCAPPIVPRSSWEVLDAGSGSPLGKEELGRVQPRLQRSGWVLGSGLRSPSYPALTLNPSIPGSPTTRAGPLPVVLHPTPPHPTLTPGRPENPGWNKTSLRRKADSGTLSSLTAPLKWMMILFFYSPKAFPQSPFTVPPKQTKRVKWAPRFKHRITPAFILCTQLTLEAPLGNLIPFYSVF